MIQGHTDSQTFAGVNSVDEQFVRNMDLSLKRANSVASYILQTNYDKRNSDAFRKMIVVEGKSFNEPWFGQLMSGPQLLAFLYQIDVWAKKYKIILDL